MVPLLVTFSQGPGLREASYHGVGTCWRLWRSPHGKELKSLDYSCKPPRLAKNHMSDLKSWFSFPTGACKVPRYTLPFLSAFPGSLSHKNCEMTDVCCFEFLSFVVTCYITVDNIRKCASFYILTSRAWRPHLPHEVVLFKKSF